MLEVLRRTVLANIPCQSYGEPIASTVSLGRGLVTGQIAASLLP